MNREQKEVLQAQLNREKQTIAELKQLNVDYKGGTYQIPTFEEALAEFADEGLVFYAHINGDINQDPQIAARLEELLEQYDAYDNVVFFIGSGEHSLYNPVDGTVEEFDWVSEYTHT